MADQVTLASWNVFQGLHHSSKRDAWVGNRNIEDHIRALDTDVMVLPEAWRFARPDVPWAEDLARELGYQLHAFTADEPSRPREHVPFRMVVMTRVAASRLDDYPLSKFGDFGQRAAVRVRLDDSGLVLAGAHMYGIHLLLNMRPRDWMRERAELGDLAASVDVLAGDMNMWSPIVGRDAQPLRAAVKGRTFPAYRPHSQIDHILVSDRVAVSQSHVLGDNGSDHLGIKVTLSVAEDPK